MFPKVGVPVFEESPAKNILFATLPNTAFPPPSAGVPTS